MVATDGVVPGLGHYPTGDPQALFDAARQLRRAAGVLDGARRPTTHGWSSAAATRVRQRLDTAVGTAQRWADELRATAAALDRAGHTLAADQRDWLAAARRLDGGRP
jgi:hypothetical protein